MDIAKNKDFEISSYLEVKQEFYDACLCHIEHQFVVESLGTVSLGLHFVKFDGTGRPKFKELAQNVVDHLITYSIPMHRRPNLNHVNAAKLFREARSNFNLKPESGEPGEILLYFLLETVLKAPQLICKIGLKTNRNDETKGADGIHATWDDANGKLNLFAGESKLHQSFSSAISDTFKSISKLHRENLLNRDLLLTTQHFKHVDGKMKEKILSLLDQQTSSENFDLTHACLIGYDWSKYSELNTLNRSDFISNFEAHYKENVEKFRLKTLQDNLKAFTLNHLSLHFFFLPFDSVQTFREEFNKCLTKD